MKKYIAGIDAGTTGVTVMIFDLEGNVMSSGYSEYPCKFPHPAWVEQDMNVLWAGVCIASRQATDRFRGDVKNIVSIGLSSQRGSFFPIDENWSPLCDAIVWSDMRAIKETQWIEDTFGKEGYHAISGVVPSSMWAYPKYKWFIDHKPDLYNKAWKFVNGQEWILNKLGSKELFTVASDLNLNGMSDVKTLDWSDTLLEAIGFSKDKLPPIIEPLKSVGMVSKEASIQTGFAEGTVLTPGGGDQQCAAVGSGIIKEGIAELTLGTSTVMVAQVNQIQENPDKTLLFGSHAIPNRWDMEGISNSSGACLRWWRDTFGNIEKKAAVDLNVDPYDLITLAAQTSPLGSNGLIFFPFFNGQCAPYYHDNARGGYLGLTQIHTRSDTARAVLEGVIYELRMIVEAMEASSGEPFEAIRLSGGGARSTFWSQMQADIYGRPVEKLKVFECSTLGAAILGAVGAGAFTSVEDAVESTVHTFGIIEPDMDKHKEYTKMYEIFKEAFEVYVENDIFNKLTETALTLRKI